MSSCTVEIKGEKLDLLPLKAIYWSSKKTLIVSDLHLGKAGHFRKHGIAVSRRVHLHDLQNLIQLFDELNPEEVYFLGDLFHSDRNSEWLDFLTILQKYKNIRFTLIEGNHDILSEYPDQLTVVKEMTLGPFSFTHYRKEGSEYNISGHIHPGVTVRGRAREGVTVPCFLFSKEFAVMPAFGQFTGIKKVRPLKNDTVYAIADNQVIELK